MRVFVWIDEGCLADHLTGLPAELSSARGGEAFVVALALLQ